MTHKRIIWGTHTADALKVRGFTRQMIQWLLHQGIRAPERTDRGEQRWSRRGYFRGHGDEAKVVYVEQATNIEIVSVHWLITEAERRRRER